MLRLLIGCRSDVYFGFEFNSPFYPEFLIPRSLLDVINQLLTLNPDWVYLISVSRFILRLPRL